MRDHFSKLPQDEYEHQITQIIGIFMHIRDQDLFEHIYKTSLGKRLLESHYFYDAEREVIKLLKKEKGATYT